MLLVVAVAGYGYMPHFGSPLTTAPLIADDVGKSLS